MAVVANQAQVVFDGQDRPGIGPVDSFVAFLFQGLLPGSALANLVMGGVAGV